MSRKFDIGRQNEVLMNSTHYDIFKLMQYYFNHPNDSITGPETFSDASGVINGALWLDRFSDSDSADLKYFDNGVWKLLFGDRFKLITNMLDAKEPENPIEGQLWINSSGVMMYYKGGQFIPIKANLSDVEDASNKYEDFLIISPLKNAEHAILNNFSKFLFSHTPIEEWKVGVRYYYQQGVIFKGTLYVCNREHYSTNSTTISNPYYWSRIDSLIQFLVPNTYTDKIFINGKFNHEKKGEILNIKEITQFKSFSITFDYEDETVLHDTLRFDVEDNPGFYDTATLLLAEDIGKIEVPDSDAIIAKPAVIDDGYIINTNISLYISEEDILREKDESGNYINDEYIYGSNQDYKLVTAIHTNPVKLDKISKHFIRINNKTKIIPILKENTEFYAVKDGVGKLLLESTSDNVYDYTGVLSDNKICIKLADHVTQDYEYIYAIHYDFVPSAKKAGKLYRKKIQLNDDTSIYIGKEDPRNLCVYAQGLFYQQASNTYVYNYDTEYIEFKEKLLDSSDQRLDISVVRFPNIFKGKLTSENYKDNNFISGRGYRIDLNAIPYDTAHCLGFVSGVQVDTIQGFTFYKDDQTAVYFPNFTKQYVIDHQDELDWVIVETDWLKDGSLTHSMFRGKHTAKVIDSMIAIPITRDPALSTDTLPYLNYLEAPIIFVDGIYISQKDISIYEKYITVEGLAADQEVVLLADKNSNVTIDDIIEKTEILVNSKNYDPALALEEDITKLKMIEDIHDINSNVDILTSFIYEDMRYLHEIYNFSILSKMNSDNILFEDNIANVLIRTERNDSSIIYLKNGLICDTDSVTTTQLPTDKFDGQIVHLLNAVQDAWYMYSKSTMMWEVLNESDTAIVSNNVNGYTSYNDNVNILIDLDEQKYCTYFSYVYSDTIEKSLLTGFCDPDGFSGVNDGVSDFRLNIKHHYVPGRNELTVYLNGIRQNLVSPFEVGFDNSTNKECYITGTNTFVLAIDNGTTTGKAISAYDGYFTYETIENGFKDYMYKKVPLTDDEIQTILNTGMKIKLISSPNKNTIFYVIEPCETGESMSCERHVLNFTNALSAKGAYANNTYSSQNLNLNKGHIKVFINGLRQPYGSYKNNNGDTLVAYNIVDSHTIQVLDPLIGGHGGNLGDDTIPLFPINVKSYRDYFDVIDEITVELRNDYNLREITLPLNYGQTTFGLKDGLPEDLFKTKDTIMIYINGYAYGNTYKNEFKTITLLDNKIENIIDHSGNNFITFEWR